MSNQNIKENIVEGDFIAPSKIKRENTKISSISYEITTPVDDFGGTAESYSLLGKVERKAFRLDSSFDVAESSSKKVTYC